VDFVYLPKKYKFFVVKLSYILPKITLKGRFITGGYLTENNPQKQLYLKVYLTKYNLRQQPNH